MTDKPALYLICGLSGSNKPQLTKKLKIEIKSIRFIIDEWIISLYSHGYPAKGVKVYGQDKLIRLNTVSYLVQSSKVFFPLQGAEQLIVKLVGFGIEKHGDLADAFVILLSEIIEYDRKIRPSVALME